MARFFDRVDVIPWFGSPAVPQLYPLGPLLRAVHASLKVILATVVGIVLVLISSTVWPSYPAQAAVGIGLGTYTNACVQITVTNLNRFPIEYVVTVERNRGTGWPDYTGAVLPYHRPAGTSPIILPMQKSSFTEPVLVYAPPCAWRVSVAFCRSLSRLDSVRYRISDLLDRHGLSVGALRPSNSPRVFVASGPEMEQE